MLEIFRRAMPKVDQHAHLLVAVRQAAFAEMAARSGKDAADSEALRARWSSASCANRPICTASAMGICSTLLPMAFATQQSFGSRRTRRISSPCRPS